MLATPAQSPPPEGFSARLSLPVVLLAVALALAGGDSFAADEPAAGPPEPERLDLTTSDGIDLATWYYAVPAEADVVATVILLHDLGGSHEKVEPLALGLQAAGCAVLVPDLRGHGASPIEKLARAAGERKPWELLKANDFAAMCTTSGGRLRDQSSVRGDVECVRNWIKQQGGENGPSLERLFVVGCGLGGAVAATWTIADSAWPAVASGPQGGDVRGLVLVDPAFTTKGFSIGQSLSREPVRTTLPVMVIAAGDEGDSDKIFDQLKRQRPKGWFDLRARDTSPAKFGEQDKDDRPEASVLLVPVGVRTAGGGSLRGDALAAWRSADGRGFDTATYVAAFIKRVLASKR